MMLCGDATDERRPGIARSLRANDGGCWWWMLMVDADGGCYLAESHCLTMPDRRPFAKCTLMYRSSKSEIGHNLSKNYSLLCCWKAPVDCPLQVSVKQIEIAAQIADEPHQNKFSNWPSLLVLSVIWTFQMIQLSIQLFCRSSASWSLLNETKQRCLYSN